MKKENFLKCLEVPDRRIDAVLDTDAYNETDDQFAISYLINAPEKINVKGLTAAPFLNGRSASPKDGMEKSYEEIKKILTLAHREDLIPETYPGSETYLPDEKTPVISEAARYLAKLSDSYTEEDPLYIVAIGAITNVASAFLMKPDMKDRCVIVWLGGHARHRGDTAEFNMMQDVAAARVIFGSGAPVVQLPCVGVVDRFYTTKDELENWLKGKNILCDYLAESVREAAEEYGAGKPWSRIIWDVTAVGWLLNDNGRFMESELLPVLLPGYDNKYVREPEKHLMRYVNYINRDALMEDLFKRITAVKDY